MKVIIIVFVLFFVLFCPSVVFAQVVINEFSSIDNSDWIELFNKSDAQVDLYGWVIKDTASSPIKEFDEKVIIPPSGYCAVEAGNRLNKAGDRIELYHGGDLIDCVSYGNGNKEFCKNNKSSDVGSPGENQTASRLPNAIGLWSITSSTKEYSNDESLPPANLITCITPTPNPTQTPTPVATLTPAPKPSPTVFLTPKPVAAKVDTPKPTYRSSATPQVLAKETSKPATASAETKVSPFAYGFIGIGLALVGAACAPFIIKEYTKRTRDELPQQNKTAY